ncbi:hypothetical protein [Pyrobaculum neutrophilum]|uniref:Uncharacterized protein n=1 Tax=Pyrobaculum neutrophilum (strain DSM 2338 / JCM 9278 / NBRC 100436 / V24Sta) TaxID=444157 RepID=B1YCR2_PYRNV|nr:hypothetical protein [Pyrobaculum neutrophilum]ACB39575.1 conserved hypothetical protein [Pyrobaculum neutrophilum V24Sta]
MQTAVRAKLLQYPPPPVLTPQLITTVSLISTRLYGLFDLGVFLARLVEAGVQKFGDRLDPCWLYVVLPNGYKHFAYFSNDVPEASTYATLYPDPYLGALFIAGSGRRAAFRPLGNDYLDGLFETLAQSEGWNIHVSNYVEYESHQNKHVVDKECIVERLKSVLPREATYEKDALLSVLVPTMPQAFLTDPQLMKLISLGLMEYRETTIVPTQLLVSLLGMLF